jgi:hypothetical protein
MSRSKYAIVAMMMMTAFAQAAEPDAVRCQQLRDMARAWAGVQLTPQQEVAKKELVRWWYKHCRRSEVQL